MRTIIIDGIEYSLVPTKNPNEVKVVKVWQPKQFKEDSRYYSINSTTNIMVVAHDKCSHLINTTRREMGNYFPTEEEAEKASLAIKQYLYLLAYKREFDANFVPDWSNSDQVKYCIAISDAKYYYCSNGMSQPTTVYFSKAAVVALVDKLNSGEVVLPV